METKEQAFLDAKAELEAMIAKKKSKGEGLRNFDVWPLREKANKARNAWRAEQRKTLKLVDEKTFREQIAREIEEMKLLETPCDNESCSTNRVQEEAKFFAAAIARGEGQK